MNTAPYLVAHITDLHIKAGGKLSYRLVDTAGALHRCIDTLLAAPQQPDAVIVTGDLVDFGAESEYQFLRQILQRLSMPVRLLPGNHDSRGAPFRRRATLCPRTSRSVYDAAVRPSAD